MLYIAASPWDLPLGPADFLPLLWPWQNSPGSVSYSYTYGPYMVYGELHCESKTVCGTYPGAAPHVQPL